MTEERKQFGNSLQFILTCTGYAVGLGNIWRFPFLAYENGGGAFLIPYLCCSFLIGFPILYFELSLGQFSQLGPAVVYGKIRPYAQGIGLGMTIMSIFVSIYYNLICAWALLFITAIFRGQYKNWATCGNDWNDLNCLSSLQNKECAKELSDSDAFYFNGTCYLESAASNLDMKLNQSATAQFFENYILQKTQTMEDLGEGMNWPLFGALAFVWMITAMSLSKGVKLIGKIAYVTTTLPYIIVAILFVRSITLDGANMGLDYYLFKIDWVKILDFDTWQRAATQLCFSLAIGFGCLLSLSSYNPRSYNCFRDALIITLADGFMSIFGGTAVFSILGFMAKQQKKHIKEVVADGVGLAFIAYPEAMSQINIVPWLWAFLFFLMLFSLAYLLSPHILGISSQFGLAEVVCATLYDHFPSTRVHKPKVVAAVCFFLFLGGIIMTTKAGYFYFIIFNEYSASFALCILILCELILICYIYGIRNYVHDLGSMFGYSKHWFGKIFGPTGLYFKIIWCVVAPVSLSVLLVFMLIKQTVKIQIYAKDTPREYIFPSWSLVICWMMSLLPLSALPIMLIANIIHFRNLKKPLRQLAELSPDWPKSYTHNLLNTVPIENTLPAKSSSNLYKIRPIEISPSILMASDACNPGNIVSARPGKSV